jgi:DNA-binding transcriptional MerR regulator
MQIDVNRNGRSNPVLTITDVSGMLGIHQNTVRRWSDMGLIRCFRVSQRGDRRYKYEDIANFLDGLNSRNV